MNGQTNKYIAGTVAGIVLLAIGGAVGFMVARQGGQAGSTNTFQAGWDAAKKRLADTGFVLPMMGEMKSVSGTVQEIKNDGMTVKIRPLEPLADPALDVRTVKFDANTKFYLQKQKDPATYQKEFADFNRAMQQAAAQAGKGAAPVNPAAAAITPPQPFEKVEINRGDIKKNEQATVMAANDIKDAKEFVAT